MFWASKKYHLEDMTFRELVVAYVQYPAIQTYFGIACVVYSTFRSTNPGHGRYLQQE